MDKKKFIADSESKAIALASTFIKDLESRIIICKGDCFALSNTLFDQTDAEYLSDLLGFDLLLGSGTSFPIGSAYLFQARKDMYAPIAVVKGCEVEFNLPSLYTEGEADSSSVTEINQQKLQRGSVTALDHQVGGDHYKKLKIQPVEFIMANDIGYMEGNVIKYVVRHKDKGGIADLEKAMHYLQMLIEQERKQQEEN